MVNDLRRDHKVIGLAAKVLGERIPGAVDDALSHTLGGEQGSGVLEAGAAVGRRGELDVDDAADALETVKEVALQQVADVEGVFGELREGNGANEELLAGERFGLQDGVASAELQDHAACILAGWEPVFFEVDGGSIRSGRSCAGLGEENLTTGGEDLGQVAEGLGEQLPAPSLGTDEGGDGDPVGCRRASHLRLLTFARSSAALRSAGQAYGCSVRGAASASGRPVSTMSSEKRRCSFMLAAPRMVRSERAVRPCLPIILPISEGATCRRSTVESAAVSTSTRTLSVSSTRAQAISITRVFIAEAAAWLSTGISVSVTRTPREDLQGHCR